jgi:hypothetical protein
MTTETYQAKNGAKQYRPVMTEGEYMEADDEGVGLCLACGAEASGVEPDARGYECETCGERKVYGIPELLIMGLVKFA